MGTEGTVVVGSKIDYEVLRAVIEGGKAVMLHEDVWQEVGKSHSFLRDFAEGKVLYGINTGFGPMAQYRVGEESVKALQYNIIRSHACGMGEPLSEEEVRAVLMARLGTFIQGMSGVHEEVIRLLVDMLNYGIYPYIPQHGSVGASGDLVQLAHMALAMIGEGKVFYKGKLCNSGEVFSSLGISPLKMYMREGLALTNGTSVMLGISYHNQRKAEQLLRLSILSSVWMNEIAGSFDDMLADGLHKARRHEGQIRIAEMMRGISMGSGCIKRRDGVDYQIENEKDGVFGEKVQAFYSLRCVPQILGPIWESLKHSREVILEEYNGVSDNPVIDREKGAVYHGGNFHGDYISLEADNTKVVLTRLCMLAERQLNYLFHDKINGVLPPFLNRGVLGLNYGMQACQFTATSTTAENQTLSFPNYVHSIPNNNDNQDIVSMGTNSALLCKRVIENCYQVMSIHYTALAQASDCLGIVNKLSAKSRKMYDAVREITSGIEEDRSLYAELAEVNKYLQKVELDLPLWKE